MLERNGHFMTSRGMLSVFIYGCIILLLQYFIVKKIKPYCKHVNIYYFIIALFFGLNLVGFNLLSDGKDVSASFFSMFMIALIIAGLFYVIAKYNIKLVFLATLSLACSSFFATATLGDTQIIDKIIGSAKSIEPIEPIPSALSETLPENYMPQDFIKKPNIYLLAFDAMTPKNVVQKLLELKPEETPGYFDVFEKNDMQIIPNVFSARNRTLASFSSMLALDMDWYTQLYGRAMFGGRNMLAGVQWTPTYDIFDRNGYELRILHFTDTYNNNNVSKRLKTRSDIQTDKFCQNIAHIYGAWGYCIITNTDIDKNKRDIYYGHIQAVALSQTPVFSHSYIRSPAHASSHIKDYDVNNRSDFEKYKAQYLENTVYVAELVQKYRDAIISNDEDAIILVFGDHGAQVTKGTENDIESGLLVFGDHGARITQGSETDIENSQYTKTDIIQDNYGVVLAVHDPHGCQIAEPVVTTLPDMMYNLITCLTGGKPVMTDRYNSEADFIDYLYDPVSVQ
ncbi:MAG: hypothetical protein K0U39_03885 [Alphaproteobacteria bacterium]|nr:hypothetical protein [Alphaproteobacteria bacterium]